jgi:hypothetical protein
MSIELSPSRDYPGKTDLVHKTRPESNMQTRLALSPEDVEELRKALGLIKPVHAYGSLEGLTMCGIHERALPPQYVGYIPPRRGTKDRDTAVTCAACLDRLY